MIIDLELEKEDKIAFYRVASHDKNFDTAVMSLSQKGRVSIVELMIPFDRIDEIIVGLQDARKDALERNRMLNDV